MSVNRRIQKFGKSAEPIARQTPSECEEAKPKLFPLHCLPPAVAAMGISLSFFSVAAFSVNMYSMPLDVFAPDRAAFAVSLLVSAYGAMQAVASPALGAIVDRYGYSPICVGASVTPLAAVAILRWTDSRR